MVVVCCTHLHCYLFQGTSCFWWYLLDYCNNIRWPKLERFWPSGSIHCTWDSPIDLSPCFIHFIRLQTKRSKISLLLPASKVAALPFPSHKYHSDNCSSPINSVQSTCVVLPSTWSRHRQWLKVQYQRASILWALKNWCCVYLQFIYKVQEDVQKIE